MKFFIPLSCTLVKLAVCRFKQGSATLSETDPGPLLYELNQQQSRLARDVGAGQHVNRVPADACTRHLWHASLSLHSSFTAATPNLFGTRDRFPTTGRGRRRGHEVELR